MAGTASWTRLAGFPGNSRCWRAYLGVMQHSSWNITGSELLTIMCILHSCICVQTQGIVRILGWRRGLPLPKQLQVLGLQVIDEPFLLLEQGLHLQHAHLHFLRRFCGYVTWFLYVPTYMTTIRTV